MRVPGRGPPGQIVGRKKEVMVADAEQLMAGTSWLPSILRVSEASYSRGLWRQRQPDRPGNADRC